jgi:transcription antitermination factor NusG
LNPEKKWFVVYTRPRWEKKVAATMLAKGIENYCPLNKVTRQWSDRKKIVEEPLFKGYVFVSPEQSDNRDIKKIDGIINYVYWLGKPAVVRESELNTIKKFLQEFNDVEVTDKAAVANDKVIVRQGVLMDHKGIIIEVWGNKAKVKIDSMGIQLTAFFDRANLEKLKV